MLDDGEAKAPPALHFHPSLIPGRVLGFGSLVVTEKFIKGYIRDRELGGPNGCRGRKGAADFSLVSGTSLIRWPETVPSSPLLSQEGLSEP